MQSPPGVPEFQKMIGSELAEPVIKLLFDARSSCAPLRTWLQNIIARDR
jgi:hypothetical protein